MATLVKAITHVSGEIIYSSSVRRNEDDLVSTINALNSANITTSGVDNVNLNNGCVDADKIDGEVKFYQEVFS